MLHKLHRKVDDPKGESSGTITTPSQEVPLPQSEFTETQIVSILKVADAGGSYGQVRKLGASDIKRLNELEHENGRL
jgi:hypothetical protein